MVNYIKHFEQALTRFADDPRPVGSQHRMLYVALFNCWNQAYFRNPISVSRHDLMRLSGIGAAKTYYRCMGDLHDWGYILYTPSRNVLLASKIHMVKFDATKKTKKAKRESKPDTSHESAPDSTGSQGGIKQGSSSSQGVPPYINNTNSINNLNSTKDYEQADENSNLFNGRSGKTRSHQVDRSGPKKSARHQTDTEDGGAKRKQGSVPESLDEAVAYFEEKKSTAAEAEKFHNYFESIGWRVGGRAAMKDWRAAARNWITNSSNFNNSSHGKQQPFKPQLTGKKNYAEPF